MIIPDPTVFPGNAVVLIAEALRTIDSDSQVFERPLRSSDPNQSMAIFPVRWAPVQQSLEIGHYPSGEPTLQTYSLAAQGFVKHGDKDIALATSTVLSKRIRDTLYRNVSLRIALQSLSVNDGVSQERYMKATLRSQDYISNQVKTTFAHISVLDILIETETT